MEIRQNTLYLTTPGLYVSRENLTLRIEQDRELKLVIPIHHLESICVFGPIMLTPQVLQLCWENSVSVNCFSETGYFFGRWEGLHNTSVMLRRNQYRAADDATKSLSVAKQCIVGKIQNSRQNVLRSARESNIPNEAEQLQTVARDLGDVIRDLEMAGDMDVARGHEGIAASRYFSVFSLHLKQQRTDFDFVTRSRRPPLDRINCLLSFLYAVLLHDVIAALTATGLDPFVGFLHVDRPARPSLALDMMEEFRPLIVDRLAITLVNRRQVDAKGFKIREGGAVELSDTCRKEILKAYQTRKQDVITHPVLNQECRIGQLMLIQARILARHLRGDIPEYLPCVLR